MWQNVGTAALVALELQHVDSPEIKLPSDEPTAFFSYSREDSEFALRLAGDLKSAGANVWLDQLDIQPGQRWARAVQDALNGSPRMLVILSPTSVDSTHVEDEVNFALEENKAVIPILYRNCKVPFQLRPFQYVDFRADYDRGLKLLLRGLGVAISVTAAAALAESQPAEIATKVATPSAEPKPRRRQKKAASPEEMTPDQMSVKADEFFDQGDYANAFLLNRTAAEAGHPGSMTSLAAMYQKGYGVRKNYKSALDWYRRAVEAEDVSGMYLLGAMYAEGHGVRVDEAVALRWFRKAAKLGYPNAMSHLGSLYLGGEMGVEQDFKQALAWYRKAADAGEEAAMNNLGLMYENGYGVRQNLKTAIGWYRKAAELGYKDAKKALKRLGQSEH